MEATMAKALILGAGGNFGSHAERAFQAAGWEVARYSRGSDMAAAAKGAEVIVNAMNPPMYHDWARLIPEITGQVLAAAKTSGARVLLPGNVYPYGQQPGLWGPETPHLPCARKGAIRAEMEAQYRASGQPVLILRGGDFLDEGSTTTFMNMLVLKEIEKGKMTRLGNAKVKRAYAYLPDMARAGAALVGIGAALPDFVDMPFAGLTFSMDELQAELERQLVQPVKAADFRWWLMTLTSPFWELAREMREMRYLFETDHALDPAPLAALLPGFQGASLAQVVEKHLRARG
jgi:nucleoside-diphosphate-sugar epimerase